MGFKMIRLNKNMDFQGFAMDLDKNEKKKKFRVTMLPWFNQQRLEFGMIQPTEFEYDLKQHKVGFLKWFKPHNQIIGIGLNKWLCFSNLGYHLLLVGGYYMVNDGY